MIEYSHPTPVSEVLKKFDGPLYLMPNPGNAGDSLIFSATLQYFENHNIQFEILKEMRPNIDNKVVIYGGGGNFGGKESRAAKFIEYANKKARAVILLPHTVFGAEDLLSKLGSNCHLFCRELVSFAHVSEYAKNANVYHHDDLVFSCDIKAILDKEVHKRTLAPHFVNEIKRRIAGNSDYDLGLSLHGFANFTAFLARQKLGLWRVKGAELSALRTDVEKTSVELPSDNIDISATLELSSCDPELALLSTKYFLEIINSHKVIKTNRLHVGIAAALLGKEVHLMANNYFKVRAIYDYSIKGKFQNVIWESISSE